MSKSKRLASVLRIAISRERDAARELATYKDTLAKQQQRLAELLAYRDDYGHQTSFGDEHRTDAGKLHDRRAFLAGLVRAISQQQHRVEAARADYQEQKRRWLAIRGKCQALDKAIARYRRHELTRAEQREQAEGDECAQRRTTAAREKTNKIDGM